MFSEKTVLIIGAGGSSPYGYPLGSELLERITENIENECGKEFLDLIKAGIKEKELDNFKKILHSYKPEITIDQIIKEESNKNGYNMRFSQICRVTIAQALIPFEDEKLLMDTNDWYKCLAESMLTKSHDDLSKNTISLITFNYDRSLEHYLYCYFKEKYNIEKEQCAGIMDNFKVNHLYFQLGHLDWENINGQPIRPYSPSIGPSEITIASSLIKTIYEPIDDSANFKLAYMQIKEANSIYFLGFGFDSFNLKKLNMDKIGKEKIIAGTAYDISAEKKKQIEVDSNYIIKTQNLIDCKILDFFNNNYCHIF